LRYENKKIPYYWIILGYFALLNPKDAIHWLRGVKPPKITSIFSQKF